MNSKEKEKKESNKENYKTQTKNFSETFFPSFGMFYEILQYRL